MEVRLLTWRRAAGLRRVRRPSAGLRRPSWVRRPSAGRVRRVRWAAAAEWAEARAHRGGRGYPARLLRARAVRLRGDREGRPLPACRRGSTSPRPAAAACAALSAVPTALPRGAAPSCWPATRQPAARRVAERRASATRAGLHAGGQQRAGLVRAQDGRWAGAWPPGPAPHQRCAPSPASEPPPPPCSPPQAK